MGASDAPWFALAYWEIAKSAPVFVENWADVQSGLERLFREGWVAPGMIARRRIPMSSLLKVVKPETQWVSRKNAETFHELLQGICDRSRSGDYPVVRVALRNLWVDGAVRFLPTLMRSGRVEFDGATYELAPCLLVVLDASNDGMSQTALGLPITDLKAGCLGEWLGLRLGAFVTGKDDAFTQLGPDAIETILAQIPESRAESPLDLLDECMQHAIVTDACLHFRRSSGVRPRFLDLVHGQLESINLLEREEYAVEVPASLRATIGLEPELEPSSMPEEVYGEAFPVEAIKDQFVGADHLVDVVGAIVDGRLLARARPKTPLLSVLLAGGSGSGKTFFAQTVAAAWGRALEVVQCNEFSTVASIRATLMAPLGLAEKLDHAGELIILFDEIDKAPEGFAHSIMQALEQGCLDATTGRGKMHDAIVIMTSNFLGRHIDVVDPKDDVMLRKALVTVGGLSEPFVERIDIVRHLPRLEGEAAFPFWRKALAEWTSARGLVVEPTPEVLTYLEGTLMASNSSPGARARLRLIELETLPTGNLEIKDGMIEAKTVYPAYMLHRRGSSWLHGFEERSGRFRTIYGDDSGRVEHVLETIRASAVKREASKPVAVVLVVGASGSGKTFLAEALATSFGKDSPVTVQCDQLSERHGVSNTLFGAPVGYVGSDQGGLITRPLSVRDDRVVLFDRVECATPELVSAIASIVSGANITDKGTQQPVSVSNAVVVLTLRPENALDLESKTHDDILGYAIKHHPDLRPILNDVDIAVLVEPSHAMAVRIAEKAVHSMSVPPDLQIRALAVAEHEAAACVDAGARAIVRAVERAVAAEVSRT